ncbi:MAG: class I SAM-dependent methyltransferase [Bradyrhizobium sp.]
MEKVRRLIKRHAPNSFLRLVRTYNNRQYNNLSNEQVFTKIYESGVWGASEDASKPFYSGSGSRRDDEVAAYVHSVQQFLRSFQSKPDVVDLGCGDFAVGCRIRSLCNNYVACDVVPNLIKFNKAHYRDLHVDFRMLDLAKDQLPRGEVGFVRQVLQHLSNEAIHQFVARASLAYAHLVVTEHLPATAEFEHNVDKLTGPGTRMGHDSGVVLTSPPFNLRAKATRELCRVNSVDTGVLVTTLYSF